MSSIDTFIRFWDTKEILIKDLFQSQSALQGPPLFDHSQSSVLTVIISSCIRYYRYIKRYLLKNYNQPKFILYSASILLTGYIFLPSFSSTQMTYSKRPDKYTTGFINPSVDCFANSTIQSLATLPTLNNYFNDIISVQNSDTPAIPLHISLLHMINRLQQPIYKSKLISVWDFLHVLEKMYNKKILRSQHDAHELLQVILESLEYEYDQLKKINGVNLPDFPFASKVESKLRCMNCKYVSNPTIVPMMILSLNVPQDSNSASLENMLKHNQSEVIEGYSCLICTLYYILSNMKNLRLSDEQISLINKMELKLKNSDLLINDDLSDDPIFKSIIENNTCLKSDRLKSTVHREVNLVKSPSILPIHLSRSIFTDTQAWRNSCCVSFPQSLKLFIPNNNSEENYILRSVIRHQGSHSSGHYECYRSKPEFYKTPLGDYYNTLPAINDPLSSIPTPTPTPTPTFTPTSTPTPFPSDEKLLAEADVDGEESPVTMSSTVEESSDPDIPIIDKVSTNSLSMSPDEDDSNKINRLRSRVSSIVSGRRASLTSALESSGSSKKKKKDKKLASILKNPYWRISDGKVSEVTTSSVLNDGKAVYMLVYERV